MVKLSDTQLVILSTACQRSSRLILPLPDRLKGGAAAKVVESLTAKGLIEEVEAKRGDPVWRKIRDGHGVTLAATDAALAVLGIDSDVAPTNTTQHKTRAGSKQAQLIGMLKRPDGASIEEITAAFGWQAHTVRGAIAGALKKKLGLEIASEKIAGRGRVYRIV